MLKFQLKKKKKKFPVSIGNDPFFWKVREIVFRKINCEIKEKEGKNEEGKKINK